MKKIIVGGILLFTGIILFLGVYILAARHSSTLGSWTTPPGRLGTALNEMGGTTAFHNSIIMIVCGIILLLWGCFEDDIVKLIKLIVKKRNENITSNSQDESLS
ncbi:hypothetical protein M3194_30785 [Paenibacillus glycanilyticus]|uniref:hypothetical protein n=1 Tax=Paenibacillus glycanilyticus TaxID=126569 RepID=UPI00203C442E|nr:hypothetical protein [Paenibacillus glycanilyticus]MCM3631671.1 hypothetical protein [Paenibacillus glycanilyticus]